MPCVGNHEYLDRGPRLYRAFFDLPANGPDGSSPAWSTTSRPAARSSPSSTAPWPSRAPARPGARPSWLDAALAATRAGWKFVMFHHPVYPSHPRRDNARAARTLGADLRQASRRPGAPGARPRLPADLPDAGRPPASRPPTDGTIYVVSVSGDKFYDQAPRDYTEVGFTADLDLPDDRDRRRAEPPDLSRMDRRGRGRRPGDHHQAQPRQAGCRPAASSPWHASIVEHRIGAYHADHRFESRRADRRLEQGVHESRLEGQYHSVHRLRVLRIVLLLCVALGLVMIAGRVALDPQIWPSRGASRPRSRRS